MNRLKNFCGGIKPCEYNLYLSRLMGKPTMWFTNRSDINRPVQAQKGARSLKFRIYVEEEMYYPSSKNKGADQLRGYREVDLRLCFRLCRLLVIPCGFFLLRIFIVFVITKVIIHINDRTTRCTATRQTEFDKV